MARPTTVNDRGLLEAALEGLELQKQRLDDQIREVRGRLGQGVARRGRPPGKKTAAAAPASAEAAPRRKLSAQARKRIAAAQKKRWAAFRKKSAQSPAA
jgi:hypothetical protein